MAARAWSGARESGPSGPSGPSRYSIRKLLRLKALTSKSDLVENDHHQTVINIKVRLLHEASVFLDDGAPGIRAGVRAAGVPFGGAPCVQAGDEHDSFRDALDARDLDPAHEGGLRATWPWRGRCRRFLRLKTM